MTAYFHADPLLARLLSYQEEDAAFAIVERAALLEYDAGMTRADAESRAVAEERRRRGEGAML